MAVPAGLAACAQNAAGRILTGRQRAGARGGADVGRRGGAGCGRHRARGRGRHAAQRGDRVGSRGGYRNAGARRNLAVGAVERVAGRAVAGQHLVEQRHDLFRIAVAQRIGLQIDARGIGPVEPRDPGLGALEIFGLLADHENGIEPADRLELDHVLAEAAFAGIHDLLDLGDQRLGRGVAHREDADRLPAHPVGVE